LSLNQRPGLIADLKRISLDYLKEFHQKNPLRPRAMKEELKTKLPPQMDTRLFNHLLSILSEEKEIIVEKETIRLITHTIALKDEEKDLRQKIIILYARGKLQPPVVKEVLAELGVSESEFKPVAQLLTKEGLLVKVKDDLYFYRQALEELEGKVVDFLKQHKEMNPAHFKGLSQVSRKFAIPLLEYFDAQKLTLRIGDKRVLRK